VIYWKDFILDDFIGPQLSSAAGTSGREERNGRLGVMEDAVEIQETGQGIRPARMAGLAPSSDSIPKAGMEAGQANRFEVTRRRGRD